MNLGRWVDVTQKPEKADIVVCLGGGTVERVKKSVELMENGYVNKKVFLLIGESWYNQPYLTKNHPELNVTINETPKNTAQEVATIKKFMKTNGYHSAPIVTDPPHTRRVKVLLSLSTYEGDEDMHFYLVGSEVEWWNRDTYYKSERARKSVWHECKGILYGIWKYGILRLL